MDVSRDRCQSSLCRTENFIQKLPDTIVHKSTRKSISNKKKFQCHHFGIKICSVPGRTARARSVGAKFSAGICFILLYTVYILYTYVLQLIINSTMYTIVPTIKVLKLLSALTYLTCNKHSN